MEDEKKARMMSAEIVADALECVIDAAFDGNKSHDVAEPRYAIVMALLGYVLVNKEGSGVKELVFEIGQMASQLWGDAKANDQRVLDYLDAVDARRMQKEAN